MEVYDVCELDGLHAKFKEIGYEPKGEYGIPGRRYFPKGGDHRTHHIHAFNQGTKDVQRHLAFRDYLAAHPLRAKDYEQLKIQLAKQFRESPRKYSTGKDNLIQKIEQEALAWLATNQSSHQKTIGNR